MNKLKCPVCGKEITACFWTDIAKQKNTGRKAFAYTEPVLFSSQTVSAAKKKIRRDLPESDFFIFSEQPERFTEKDLANIDPNIVGAYCTKCDYKFSREEGLK